MSAEPQTLEPRMHFWFRLAIEQYHSAMIWRRMGEYKLAIKGIRKTREFLELANG